ncbi:MAG: hypothetical protein HKN46_09500 [Acidimicrobiia bacterium]|nr:hypothetical protein [Acidimicrobiia bacterium]
MNESENVPNAATRGSVQNPPTPPRPLIVGFHRGPTPQLEVIRSVIGGDFEMVELEDGGQLFFNPEIDDPAWHNGPAESIAGRPIFGHCVTLRGPARMDGGGDVRDDLDQGGEPAETTKPNP